MSKPMNLLHDIERHLRDSAMAPAAFGRAVMNDSRLVFDLRRGRAPRAGTARRVRAYLDRGACA